jgi:pantetheine-phosphate adenylyltransferase
MRAVGRGRIGLLPGSFDPPSEGHKDIILRAASICHTLYVGVALNPDKKHHLFTAHERVQLLTQIIKPHQNIQVVQFPGLVVDFAEQHKVDFIVRGLRAYSDFESEFRMALVNRQISGLETLFLMANEAQTHISSTLIRQLGMLSDERLKRLEFVPPEIQQQVFERIKLKYL